MTENVGMPLDAAHPGIEPKQRAGHRLIHTDTL
jgi:hypothetical protein